VKWAMFVSSTGARCPAPGRTSRVPPAFLDPLWVAGGTALGDRRARRRQWHLEVRAKWRLQGLLGGLFRNGDRSRSIGHKTVAIGWAGVVSYVGGLRAGLGGTAGHGIAQRHAKGSDHEAEHVYSTHRGSHGCLCEYRVAGGRLHRPANRGGWRGWQHGRRWCESWRLDGQW
jgi:hypothetical protein